MGARKKISAEKRKEAMKTVAIAQLRNVPTSPRRMRQVADLIRGVEVDKALGILRFSTRHSSRDLEKLLMSAIANWEAKNDGRNESTRQKCVGFSRPHESIKTVTKLI